VVRALVALVPVFACVPATQRLCQIDNERCTLAADLHFLASDDILGE
jgi:hypothetical protein